MYLRKGLGWFPNYVVNLKGEEEAEIILRALVVNDAEAIENANINFVVGVPNFKYNNILTPMTGNQSLIPRTSQGELKAAGRGTRPRGRRVCR